MRIQCIGSRCGPRAAVAACGAAAAMMCGGLRAASQDAGPGGQSVLLESKAPVALYQTANGPTASGTAPADAFPLRSDGKVEKRYRVHYNGGTYYVNPMDVTVHQAAVVTCAKAPTRSMASRFGAGSDRCQ